VRDLREGIRSLRRAPGFALACVLVLGLGIGLASAMYSVVYAVLLRPLPVQGQGQLVVGWGENRSSGFAHFPLLRAASDDFAAAARSLRQVAFSDYNGAYEVHVREGEVVFPLKRALVSGGFFATLGVTPLLGRLLTEADDHAGADPVAVIAEPLWRSRFGASRAVLGRRLTMHGTGQTYTVVGVVPAGVAFPAGAEFWAPFLPTAAGDRSGVTALHVDVVGRLQRGAAADDVASDLTSFFGDSTRGPIVPGIAGVAIGFPELLVGTVRRPLQLLAAAVALLLLVACGNVAGLLLMRGVDRAREVAVRKALGARATHLVRLQLAEGLVLAAGGAVVGVVVAVTALGALGRLLPGQLPRLDEAPLHLPVLVGACGLALVTTLLFGCGPAMAAARVNTAGLLRSGSASAGGRRRQRLMREGVVAAQVALAVLVLSASGLLLRTVRALQRAELGLDPARVMTVELAWDFTRVDTPARSAAAFDRLLPTVGAIPGVSAVSALHTLPFAGTAGMDGLVLAADRPATEQEGLRWFNLEITSPGYFDVFRVPLRGGRVIGAADRAGSPRVVVLSEGAALALWPGQDAVGRQVTLGTRDSTRWTVAGVVADTRYREFRRARETIYFAQQQSPFPVRVTGMAVRSAIDDPLTLMPALRAAVREVDPGLTVVAGTAMSTHLARPLAQPRFNAALLSIFGASTLMLVLAGLYALLSFAVRLRRRELAIRLAVGASPGALRHLVLRSAGGVVAVGVGGGLVLSLASARLIESLLYGVRSTDVVSLAIAAVLLAVVGALASILPARAAARAPASLLLRDS